MKRLLQLMLALSVVVSCATSASVDFQWTNDVSSWRKIAYQGVEFKAPKEFLEEGIAENFSQLVIRGKKDSYLGWLVSESVHYSIQRCIDGNEATNMIRKRISAMEKKGGVISHPPDIQGSCRFYVPSGWQEQLGKVGFPDKEQLIFSSKVGYIIPIEGVGLLSVSIHKDHNALTKVQWQKEGSVFSEKETQLVYLIAASVKLSERF